MTSLPRAWDPGISLGIMWGFPKIRVFFFFFFGGGGGGPYNKDPAIWGTIWGSPIFGNSHVAT